MTEEEEAEQHGALEICPDEIKCNFFISLLGDRYGWIPPRDVIPQDFFEVIHLKRDLNTEDARKSISGVITFWEAP